MALTYGLRTARDLLVKLERDAQLLRGGVTSDRFFNFVITAHTLVEWVDKDPGVPKSAKDALPVFRLTNLIRACGDLANASKHFRLDPKRHPSPAVTHTDSDMGFGVGGYGKGGYGVGEEEIIVELNTGSEIIGLDFMEQVLGEWRQFFDTHGI